MEDGLGNSEDNKVRRKEDGLLVQTGAVRGKISDPFQSRTLRQRPEVDLAENVGGEDIGEDSLGGLKLQRMFLEGLEARFGGAQTRVVLCDAEDDDGERANGEEDGAYTSRPYGEPKPKNFFLLVLTCIYAQL